MPPEISPWDRSEFFRERKNERPWSRDVGARWRDRDRGYGKQGWHTYTEDLALMLGPSRPNKRFFNDGRCLQIDKYGRDSSRVISGESFSQRDRRGHYWDSAPGRRSNGHASMPAHAIVKSSADDMMAYNSYPHSKIGNNWGQFYFKDQHYNNSVASGQNTRRRFGRKNSAGLNGRKALKWTRSGSLHSHGCGFSHSGSSGSVGLDSGKIKATSNFQNPSPVHSLSGNSATCAFTAPEETNSRGGGIRHSSSPKRLHLNSSACATSAGALETNLSGCGYSHSSIPKICGSDSDEIKVPVHSQNSTSGSSFSEKAVSCAAYAPTQETNSRKRPRIGWGKGLAQFEKIINGSTDTAENDGTIESPHSHSKNCTESVHPHNSVMAPRCSRVQCFTECRSPVTHSHAFCSSPGEDNLSVKALEVDTSNLCSPPGQEYKNRRDDFNLENLEVTGLATLSSSISEILQFDNLHSAESDCMRSCEISKLLVLKDDIAKKVEITESEIDLLENELRTLISASGNASPCSTSSSLLPVKCILKPSEKLCATSNLNARPAPLGHSCSEDMMQMPLGGLEGELAESRNVDIDSLGTTTSQVAESLLAGTLFSEKTHRYDESTWKADEDREGKSIVYSVKEENSGAIFTKQFASRGCMLSVDVKFQKEHMFYDLLIASNQDFARRSAKVFSKLLPTNLLGVDHLSFNVTPCWKKKALVRENLALRKRFLRFKERVLSLKFIALKRLWKEDLLRLFTSKSCPMSQKKMDLSSPVVYCSNPKEGSSIRARFSSRGRSLSLVPTADTINFASKLLEDSRIKAYSSALKMPSLILDDKEKKASRFISSNRLVEDPSTAEKERGMFTPWTSKEKEIFLNRLTTFGKDFRKIASFLERKTTADCIEFYYKNQKSDCFRGTKKKTEFPEQGKYCSTFLVTAGKRRASISSKASLDMLGAASLIVHHVNDKLTDQQKCPRNVFGKCTPKTWSDHEICKKSSSPSILGNEKDCVAADLLAGICDSFLSKTMTSCITSSMDFGEKYQERKSLQLGSSVKRQLTSESTNNANEACSDESFGEIDSTNWTDEEKSVFIQAVMSYGKDFKKISQYVRSRSSDQCKVFFSKARKCLRLDTVMHSNQHIPASDDAKGGGGSDNGNACAVETICNGKSGSRIAEDQLSSNFKEFFFGSQPARTTKMQPDYEHLEQNSYNLDTSKYAEEKAVQELESGSNIESCCHRVNLTVQDIETGFWGADTNIYRNDAIVKEDNGHGMPSNNTENVGHGILFTCCSLSGKDVGSGDVNLSSLSGISCTIQGTKTTSADGSTFVAFGENSLEKGVLRGGKNKNPTLLDPSLRRPIFSSKQRSSCKSQNPVVQSGRRHDYDLASQFESGKFSNKQFQDSARTNKYHKHSCENSSLDLVNPSQISRGCSVSIMTKNGISCTKPVSAQNRLSVVENFSAQSCHLQKCKSSKKHLDAQSQYQSKDHPGIPELQCSSDTSMPKDSDVTAFGQIWSCPPNCKMQDDHSVANLYEDSFNPKFSAKQNVD
ncbi:hypothetical protein DCAR_0521883 [Daucus carota subsp. sativus]|uniref:SANT domain-containing protein n=2 Tax=Daucus carota subsp. sativus TaxID=79200 RepID=A0AAF1B0Z2_DAUCS|nr:hypothetical protein DCAR_0521883 [Daucus carota subsp. sativus]